MFPFFQDFAVTQSGFPQASLDALGLAILPLAAQAVVVIYNLPSLAATNQTLVRNSPSPMLPFNKPLFFTTGPSSST